MVHNANASHIGGVLSSADILAVLYMKVLRLRADEPNWPQRDRFILSKGHCCAGVYAALALRGFVNLEELLSILMSQNNPGLLEGLGLLARYLGPLTAAVIHE